MSKMLPSPQSNVIHIIINYFFPKKNQQTYSLEERFFIISLHIKDIYSVENYREAEAIKTPDISISKLVLISFKNSSNVYM